MQDMVGDNNRTPVIFWVSDIYRFVGAICIFKGGEVYMSGTTLVSKTSTAELLQAFHLF